MGKDEEVKSEKRFNIREGDIGRERLLAVQSVMRGIQSENPEVLSLCTFGSSTTGKAVETSDVDGWLFIDVSRLAQQDHCDEDTFIETVVEKRDYGDRKIIKLKDGTRDKYNEIIRGRLKQSLGFTDEQLEHVRSRPVSGAIIEELIKDLLDWDTKMQAYNVAVEEINKRLSNHDYDVDITAAKMPRRPHTGILPDMFHLAIGRGIEPWRAMLVEKLGALGEAGNRIWHEIIVDTEMMENHLNSGTNKHYPRTIDQAIEAYGKR